MAFHFGPEKQNQARDARDPRASRRAPSLFRDYGISLLLVLASVLIFWKTMLPQIARNKKLDRQYLELLHNNARARAENHRLELMEGAKEDPIVMERFFRRYFGERAGSWESLEPSQEEAATPVR